MKVLVVGGGGREHAIIKKLKENKEITQMFCTPGNGGIASDAVCVPYKSTQVEEITAWAVKNGMEYVVVAQDDPLCMGLVDMLKEKGIPAFGPDKMAARIEGSKVFSKNLMKKYGIPTAAYEAFDDMEKALAYVKSCKCPIVVKADGLALGKGVLICMNNAEAEAAVTDMMAGGKFGASGSRVVVEEFLEGPEVSVLCFTDGTALYPMVSSMDHKRALDHDEGLNTGGMGVIAPNPYYTETVAERCMQEIFLPTLGAMREEGCPFHGCLYFGLMITKDGPKVIEYNCRFGDPETQVVLPLLKSDLLTVMQSVTNETLADTPVEFMDAHACCVVLASRGYPTHYEKGFEITMTEKARKSTYVAGAALKEGKLLTSGGRVLGVTAIGDTLENAIHKAYTLADTIHFDNAFCRRDIGARALKAQAEE